MTDEATIVFSEAALDAGPGAILAQEMRDEIASVYDGLDLDADFMPRGGAAELSPPGGAFLVGWRDSEPVCCGGFKRLDARTCEIKRMYVAPLGRGQGVARRLLGALEDLARERGYAVARLDTGPRQPHARALYESAGYTEIPDFNGNPVACYWAEKPLASEHEHELDLDLDLDLDTYLARIGLSGRPTLAELHRAHVAAIPFENLDPLRGVAVSLSLQDLQRKLVADRRGGYCFEHNLLFAAALRALGLTVEPILARVGPREDRERSLTHLLLRVHDGGTVWHADVGFGAGTLIEPVPFGPGEEFDQLGWRRRIVADGSVLVLQRAGAGGEWTDVYSFTPEPASAVDIEMSNWFTCTHPDSRFVGGLVITRHHADGGRTVLSDWSKTLRLIEQTPVGETALEVERGAIPALLEERFGLPGWELDDRGVPVPSIGLQLRD